MNQSHSSKVPTIVGALVILFSILTGIGVAAHFDFSTLKIYDPPAIAKDVTFDASVKADGSMQVRETWKMAFPYRIGGWYRFDRFWSAQSSVPIHIEAVKNLTRNETYRDSPNQKSGTWCAASYGLGCGGAFGGSEDQSAKDKESKVPDPTNQTHQLAIYFPAAHSLNDTFEITYSVRNAVARGVGISQFNWAVLQQSNAMKVGHLSGTVKWDKPVGSSAAQVWVDASENVSNVSTGVGEGSTFHFSLTNLPSNDRVTVVGCTSGKATPAAPQGYSMSAAELTQAQDEQSDQMAAARTIHAVLYYVSRFGVLLTIIGTVLWLLAARRRKPAELSESQNNLQEATDLPAEAEIYFRATAQGRDLTVDEGEQQFFAVVSALLKSGRIHKADKESGSVSRAGEDELVEIIDEANTIGDSPDSPETAVLSILRIFKNDEDGSIPLQKVRKAVRASLENMDYMKSHLTNKQPAPDEDIVRNLQHLQSGAAEQTKRFFSLNRNMRTVPWAVLSVLGFVSILAFAFLSDALIWILAFVVFFIAISLKMVSIPKYVLTEQGEAEAARLRADGESGVVPSR